MTNEVKSILSVEVPQETPQEIEEIISFADFLERIPPNDEKMVNDCLRKITNPTWGGFNAPDLKLYCPSEGCKGDRYFSCYEYPDNINLKNDEFITIKYICKNCNSYTKTYSFLKKPLDNDKKELKLTKLGEYPRYGNPIEPKLIRLIGTDDKDTFFKGRQCENQGLGIGAFVYYRRVVENQRNRILDNIIKVSKKLNFPKEKISIIENAKNENQFSKSIKMIKDTLPESLFINGHNPLTLLHSALSDGLHDRTDEHCLDLAQDIRIVLTELSLKLSHAVKDNQILNKSLSRLMNVKK